MAERVLAELHVRGPRTRTVLDADFSADRGAVATGPFELETDIDTDNDYYGISYNEGMRVPTPAELTCADELDPCKLPNAFLADPPLEPVISKTFEVGTHGALTANTSYSVSAYRTDLRDDIQFITVSGVNGFFDNVGKTRRQGVELGLQTQLGRLSLNAAYGFVDATFRDSFLVASPNNSQADANERILVEAGDRIPGIAQHNFKLRADYAFTRRISAGASFVYASDQYARGDENNEDINGSRRGAPHAIHPQYSPAYTGLALYTARILP